MRETTENKNNEIRPDRNGLIISDGGKKLPFEGKLKKKKGRRVKRRISGGKKALIIVTSIILVLSLLFLLFVYSSIKPFKWAREIWVETAMTTQSHKWLATAIIPGDIIDEIMSKKNDNIDVIGGVEQPVKIDNVDNNEDEKPSDPLGLASMSVGDTDYAGNTVVLCDKEQGLYVSEVSGDGYKGRIMLVDDPSRVYLATTKQKGVSGTRITDFLTQEDAIAGLNASGFFDPNENGNGGVVVGLSCSQGEYWGNYVSYYGSAGFDTSNRLIVGNISDWSAYNIRDGFQFGPVLIADGVTLVSGSSGYGIQPRAAIAQRDDGVVAFICIDGRQISYSIGCTVGELANVLASYNMSNAFCCDGGASAALAYDGALLTKNCSYNPSYGRWLPNAFLVRKK